MINHLPCECLPGESRIRDIILHVGTNDVSRERGIKNTISDIETYLTKLIDLLSKMYPQARIIYSCILPRMDNDHSRTIQVNTVSHIMTHMRLSFSCLKFYSGDEKQDSE